jgi:hypothetical protein
MVMCDPMPHRCHVCRWFLEGALIHLNHCTLVPACQNAAGITHREMSRLSKSLFCYLFPPQERQTFLEQVRIDLCKEVTESLRKRHCLRSAPS